MKLNDGAAFTISSESNKISSITIHYAQDDTYVRSKNLTSGTLTSSTSLYTSTDATPYTEITFANKDLIGNDAIKRVLSTPANSITLSFDKGAASDGYIYIASVDIEYTTTTIYFSAEAAEATIGTSFTPPTLTNGTGSSATYASSNTAVATVDSSTGEITLLTAGTTTITATAGGNEASYALTVNKGTMTQFAINVDDMRYYLGEAGVQVGTTFEKSGTYTTLRVKTYCTPDNYSSTNLVNPVFNVTSSATSIISTEGFTTSWPAAGRLMFWGLTVSKAGTATLTFTVSSDNYETATFSQKFTINETAKPTLTNSTPSANATNAATEGNITLTFSENVTIADVSKFTLSGGTLNTASATVSGATVTIPYSGLSASTQYTLTIGAGAVKDAVANTNDATTLTFFTAGSYPSLYYNYVFSGSADRKAWWDDGADKPNPASKTLETVKVSVKDYKEFNNKTAIRIYGGSTITITEGSENVKVKSVKVNVAETKNPSTLSLSVKENNGTEHSSSDGISQPTSTGTYTYSVGTYTFPIVFTITDSSPTSGQVYNNNNYIGINYIQVEYEDTRTGNTLTLTNNATNYAGSNYDMYTTSAAKAFTLGQAGDADLSKATVSTEGTAVTATLSSGTLTVTPTGTVGTSTITIEVPGSTSYKSATTTLTVNTTVIGTSDTYTYSVAVDNSTSQGFGTLTFTGAGTLTAGVTRDEVPGISMTFGKEGDTGWTVYNNTSGGSGYKTVYSTCSTSPTIVSGVPTSGNFYTFTPSVNGYLTIDGTFWLQHKIRLYGASGEYSEYFRTPSEDTYHYYGAKTYPVVLMAGETYYLYDEDETNTLKFQLHAFKFTPAFIYGNESTVEEAVTSLNVYYNVSNSFPFMVTATTDGVSFATPDNHGVATVTATTGNVTLNSAAGTETVRATIIKGDKTVYTSYVINSSYNATVYKVSGNSIPGIAGSKPAVNERIVVGDIAMTYGGCQWGDKEPQPYVTYKVSNGEASSEQTNAKADAYGSQKEYSGGQLEGFTHYVQGNGNNPKDESGYNFALKGSTNYDTPRFNVPCRGTYYKFQAYADGDLSVYIYQNGATDNKKSGSYDPTAPVNYRRLWILDEAGTPVTLKGWATNSKIPGEYADHTGTADDDAEPKFKSSLFATYWGSKHTGDAADVLKVNESTDPYTISAADQTTTAENLVLIRSGLVKYTFKVETGKTYFVFVNRSASTGISGFVLDKTSYANENYETELSQELASYSAPDAAYRANASVTLEGRAITANKWQPICLPFSMDEQQVKDVFGEGTKIAHFDNTADGKLHLKLHAYYMIYAGVPCFIKATKGYTGTGEDVPEVNHVTFLSTTTPTDITGAGEYTLQGNYAKGNIPENGYYVASGEFYRTAKGKAIKGFRCYIKPNDPSSAKALMSSYDLEEINDDEWDNTTTVIEGVFDREDGAANGKLTSAQGIYNLNGQHVGTDASRLPKGIYIVNGKKTVIK